jgi:hypothetical protein
MPKADAPVLTTMQEGDKTEITGLRSGWTQIKLSKTVIGYINVGGSPAAPRAAGSPAMPPAPLPMAAGQPAPLISSGPASALSHTYQGMLVETRRVMLIGPRRDYDYQLNNTDDKRIAFLDVTKVLVTANMEQYVDRLVTVSGVLKQTPDGKGLVLEVESLETK